MKSLKLGRIKRLSPLISLTEAKSEWKRWKMTVECDGNQLDIVLFVRDEQNFHAIDATCPHSGGPLHLGDIEDFASCNDDGSRSSSGAQWHVICPYHSFDFSLHDGESQVAEEFSVGVYKLSVDSDGELELIFDEASDVQLLSMEEVQYRCYPTPIEDQMLPQLQSLSISEGQTHIQEVALQILLTADPIAKCEMTFKAAEEWKQGLLGVRSPQDTTLNSEPPRNNMEIVSAFRTGRRGKGGTLNSRIAILRKLVVVCSQCTDNSADLCVDALASIEQWAIDLAWDIIARYSHQVTDNDHLHEFCTDFVKVAADEAKHFSLLRQRIEELGSHYGAFPIHAGLWDSAVETQDDLLARLAVVHMVHEARGLDVNPNTISKFKRASDDESVRILTIIHEDEVTHVGAGHKWFSKLYPYIVQKENDGSDDNSMILHFQNLVRKHFHGPLKPPFNAKDRLTAGLSEEWYIPLSLT